jgi:hypothetical protein
MLFLVVHLHMLIKLKTIPHLRKKIFLSLFEFVSDAFLVQNVHSPTTKFVTVFLNSGLATEQTRTVV